MEFVYPILIFVVMGIVFGVLLVVISKVFAVETDERARQDHRGATRRKLRRPAAMPAVQTMPTPS